MDRRALLLGVAAMIGMPFAAEAQTARTYRVGVLTPRGGHGPLDELLEKRMSDAGWVKGRNVVFVYRHGKGNDALPTLARELVGDGIDIILTAGTPATLAARRATATIPVVFYTVGDPVGVGIVDSLGQPGGNVTGISGITYQLAAKRLELLIQLAPDAAIVGILLNPTDPTIARVFDTLKTNVKATKVAVEPFYVGRAAEVEDTFKRMKQRRVNALLVQPDGLFWAERVTIARLASERRLPAMYAFREHVEVGGLISYGASATGMLEQAVSYVDKILRGAKPSNLPVQEPTHLEVVINASTAKTLGLTIPPSLLLRADQVIE